MTTIKIIISFMTITLWSNLAYGEVPKFLQKTVIQEKIRDTYLNTSVKFDFDLLQGDIVDGVSLGANYAYDVSPSFKQGHQTRMDKWSIQANISPGDLIPGIIPSPFSIGLNKNSSVTFIRQFKTKSEALTATPYGLNRIPLTAKKVLEVLKEGDLVAFPASMNISIGSSITNPSILNALSISRSAKVSLFLSGSYNVQVLKMEGSRVRLKVIATTQRGHRLSAGFQAGANLFGVELVNNAIKKVHPIALAKLGYERGKGKQFVLDYIFDLKYEEARKAYDSILSTTYKFKDVKAALNIFGMDELNGALVSTYEEADRIYLKDRDPTIQTDPRVHRIFKGFNVFKNRGASISLAALVVKVDGAKNFTEHNLTYRDHADKEHKYYYPVQNNFWERKSGLTYRTLKERGDVSLFGLITANELNSTTSFSDLGFRYYRQDAKLKSNEQGKFRRMLGQTLPESIYRDIDWGENSRKLNTILSYMIVLKAPLFKQIPHYNKNMFENRLNSFVKSLKSRRLFFNNNGQSNNSPGHKDNIRRLAHKLHKIVTSKTLTGRQRLKDLMSLRNFQTFRTFGLGFLISLIPDQSASNLEKLLYVKFKFAGEKVMTKDYTFSNHTKEQLYNQLNAIQRSLNNSSYDLNLSGEMEF
jgi:hypothetical protein